MSARIPVENSSPEVTRWLLLRTALWRLGSRESALDAVRRFLDREGFPRDSEPALLSVHRIDESLERLDLLCAGTTPRTGPTRPDPASDLHERLAAKAWLVVSHYADLRRIARGVLKQYSGSPWLKDHLDPIETVHTFLMTADSYGLGAALEGYRPTRGPLLVYVDRCFRRSCGHYYLDAVRYGNALTQLEEPARGGNGERTPRSTPSPESAAIRGDLVERIWQAIDEDPGSLRARAMHLRYEQEMTHSQIGNELGISSDAAKQLTYYGTKALRERFRKVRVR